MGSVHKFQRPPKNEGQFRGYRPKAAPVGGGKRRGWQLRGWQKTVLAWAALVAAASGYWAITKFF